MSPIESTTLTAGRDLYGRLYRGLLYPAYDGLIKRRRTVRYWRQAETSQWWQRARLERLQLDSLRRLLTHARETCPYYRELWRERQLDPAAVNSLDDFTSWPLLTREIIQANRDRVRSSAAFRRLYKSTGGSCGEPLHFELNCDSNDRRTAMTHRGYGWAGAGPGSKQFYIWGTTLGPVSRLRRAKTEIHRRIDRQRFASCFDMSPRRMREYARRIARYGPDVIVAYTNAVYELARFFRREAIVPCSPGSVVVGAEKLYDFQRELIEAVFRAPVFETYGSREFMLIGAECERHAGLHLSMENLLVEVVDDAGRPTPEGEEGNVAVTDLFNDAMPLIRYLNGDRAIAGFGRCPCGRGLPLLRSVVGRQLDTLQTGDGRLVSGAFFPHLLKDHAEVLRFQVVQHRDRSVTLRLMPRDGCLPSRVRKTLVRQIRAQLGDATPLRLQEVDDIPLTGTGKHRVVVRAA